MASNNRSPSILQNVHSPTAQSLKVLVKGMDSSSNTPAILTEADGTVNVKVTSGSITVGDGSGDLTVDGTVSVGNFPDFPASQTIDGTVAVSGVSGTVTVTGDSGGSLTVDGTVSVGNFPGTQTVDGTVTVGSLPSVTVGATPAVEVADYTHASTAAASVPSGFTEFLEAQAAGYKVLHLFNGTEQPISFSLEDGTASDTHYVLPAHSTMALDYKSNELKETHHLSYKYTSAAPTSGTVYGTAIS